MEAAFKTQSFLTFAIFLSDMQQQLSRHGDGVKDIAFSVEDLEGILRVGAFRFRTAFLNQMAPVTTVL